MAVSGCGYRLGAAFGMINGFMVTKMRCSLSATLGSIGVFRGYIMTGGWPVCAYPGVQEPGGRGCVRQYSCFSFLLFGFAAICHISQAYSPGTIFLRRGNEPPDCRSIQSTGVIAYGITGVGAALAGLVMLARLGTGAYSRPGI